MSPNDTHFRDNDKFSMTSLTPFKIVILGGIASGKSAVSALFAERGAVTLAADPIAHEVMLEEVVVNEIVEALGQEILDSSGSIDRQAVAKIVFADKAKLRILESILHPKVRERIHSKIHELGQNAADSTTRPVVLLDIPLAAEAGWLDNADMVVFVDCDEDIRIQRAVENRGWTAEAYLQRQSNQMPLQEKRALANHFVNNSHTVAKARNDVERLWKQFIGPRL